jgi:hypothetical protein
MGLSHFPSKRKIVCGRQVVKKTEILFSKMEKQRKFSNCLSYLKSG